MLELVFCGIHLLHKHIVSRTDVKKEVKNASLVTLGTIVAQLTAAEAIEKCAFLKEVSKFFHILLIIQGCPDQGLLNSI